MIGTQPRESLERDSPWLLLLLAAEFLTAELELTAEFLTQLQSKDRGMDGESWSMSRVSGGGVGGGDGSTLNPLSCPRRWSNFR